MKTLNCLTLSLALLTLPLSALGHTPDGSNGKKLHDASCVSCHKSMLGGDGSEMYTRDNRKVKTAKDTLKMVSMCNARTNGSWFPEDEADVAAFLNTAYYKFK